MEQPEKRVQELEAELAAITANPAFEFYSALQKAMHGLIEKMENEKLDLIDDNFQKSIFLLAQNSDKIFNSFERGQNVINPQNEDKAKKKKLDKSQAVPLG